MTMFYVQKLTTQEKQMNYMKFPEIKREREREGKRETQICVKIITKSVTVHPPSTHPHHFMIVILYLAVLLYVPFLFALGQGC